MTTNRDARFLFVTTDVPPRRGGVARYHGAVTAAFGSACELFVPPSWWWPMLIPAVACRVRQSRAQQMIVGELLPHGTIAWILRMLGGKPYAVICHGLDLRNAARVPRKRWLARRILAGAAHIIANSAYTAALAKNLGAHTERVTIVHPPLGLSSGFIGHEAGSPQESLAGKQIILSVGRLINRKGFDVLIRAMADVAHAVPNAVLVIVGDGPEYDHLRTLATDVGAPVIFICNADDQTLAEWYAACNIFALLPRELPNGDVEGFGIVYLEAGVFGKPVIGTRSGGVPEAIRDGETGILVPPDDTHATATAIAALLTDAHRSQRMGENGRAWAREHGTKQFAAHIRSVFGITERTSDPLISIIIPAYRNAHEVTQCLAALDRQTFQDFEVIIVDDGSDSPIQFSILNSQFSIRLIRQPHAGAPTARNRGAAEACGRFLFFCDADVILKDDALDRMRAALDAHPEASYAYGAFRFGWKKFPGFSFDAERLRRMPYIPTMALVRREHFPGFDPALKRFQDWDLWLTMLERGYTGTFIPSVLYVVWNMKGTMSRWVPSFVYRLPWATRRTRAYDVAADIIRTKHDLPKP